MNIVRRNPKNGPSPVTETALPPWRATSKYEVEAMEDWVNDQLAAREAQDQEADDRRDYSTFPPPGEPPSLDSAMKVARRGNVRPIYQLLRQCYPELYPIVELIKPPPRKQGQRRSYAHVYRHFVEAGIASEVQAVRDLWRIAYPEESKRHTAPSAEEIVAKRWGKTEDEILATVKAAAARRRR